MDETKVAPAGSFCWTQECPDYGQVEQGNRRKNEKTPKGVQRSQCKTGKTTCGEPNATMFYRCRHSPETIVESLAMGGDRTRLAALHRIKGVKEETVGEWGERAAAHVEQFEEPIVRARKLHRVQLDALWTSVGHKGEKGGGRKKSNEARIARGTAIVMDSRLRGARARGKTEAVRAPELMEQGKKQRPDEKPPARATDANGASREAMLRTWGTVPQSRGRGKPPPPKPAKDWQ